MRDPNLIKPTDWFLLVILSTLWGASFFAYKILDDAHVPAFTIVFGRVCIAAVALLVLVCAGGHRLPTSPRVWGAFLILGALNNVIPFSLIAFGETQISSGLASLLNATTPVFTILLAHALTRSERFTPNKLLGGTCAFAGVALLVGPTAARGLSLSSWAQIAVLGAAASYACAAIYGQRFSRVQASPLVTAAGQLCGSTILTLPLVIADHPWSLHQVLSLPVWGACVGLALLSTALAYVIYFRVLSSAGATNLLLVAFLIPISALVLGALFLNERLSWSGLFGATFILCGLALIDGRPARALVNRMRMLIGAKATT